MSDIRHQTSDDSYIWDMYDIWCLMSDVWLIISDVRCLMFDVWCVMSDVRCLKSEVGHLMSYVRCYKSDVWYMDDVWCLMSDIRHQMSDDRCLYVWMMTDVCCQKSDMWYMYVWRLMYDFLCLMYDVLCSIPGGKYSIHMHWLKNTQVTCCVFSVFRSV